ncbi:MAG TPA: rhomboid family intramembrane serine protease, partial [Bacteroidetes bacterium]|nr:rhomboid family intramembrane serine protease [Bacteroidota bacterium]
MVTSIWEDIKQQFSYGNMLTRIILVNIGVFVLMTIVRLILMPVENGITYNDVLHFFAISSNIKHDLTHPWVFITHMFLHEQVFHILWNMILLYWFGRIVGDLLGDHRVLPIYLLSGLAGGVTYILMSHLLTGMTFGHYALGASAAFMGTIVVAGVMAPDYIISLLFLGDVRLKYIVAVFVLLDLVAISWNSNTGGSFGHLGGAAMGYIIAHQLKQGNDMTLPVNNILQKITSFFSELFSTNRPGPKMAYK